MLNPILNFIATIIVAVLSLIGIYIQTKSKEKQENIESKLDTLRNESKAGDDSLREVLDKTRLHGLKLWLVNELTKIKDGIYVPNEEQKRALHDAKGEYNALGGNSYVNDMFDECRERGLL